MLGFKLEPGSKRSKTVWGIIGLAFMNVLYIVYPPALVAQPIVDPLLYGLTGVGIADKAEKITKALETKPKPVTRSKKS